MAHDQLIQRIRESVIGRYLPLQTPFGQKPLVYADYTASGRSLSFVEAQLQRTVLPFYANTHSESSLTGAQSTALREQARQIVADALGCEENDRVIFCGSGATAAIDRLIQILNLRLPRELDERYGLSSHVPAAERPVIFIGPYEHHSNELPWRETIADVVPIPLNEQGGIDQTALGSALEQYADRPLRIGSFSAASNVTGIRSDVIGITRLLKHAGALAFWDYAAAGPYVSIAMNTPGAEIDAVFLSPHKFIGGPGTPGILVIKAALADNAVPAVVGGGTVGFVSPQSHRYLADIERREEAGTPAIVESVRAGLVIGLQQAIGVSNIEALEQSYVRRAMERLSAHPNIDVLGPKDAERLAIFSLRITHQNLELHYGFVVALLNDLFGIQARGGCSCAGPYGHRLLNLSDDQSEALDQQIIDGHVALRPGWVRLSFNYFIGDEEFDYMLSALELIAQHGHKLLASYCLDAQSGLWRHRNEPRVLPVSLDPANTDDDATVIRPSAPDFAALLREAQEVLQAGANAQQLADASLECQPQRSDDLRWFLTSQDLADDKAPRVTGQAVA
ncbi:aminotransferase class V-fold PLP-dependent enzyme [Congregibacter variabilis]|uniref:Aminotransferase class V-fold PLP-dependent enzyme n=1 Tax=Congregibacter variabilis TaxID=3081200 RepID=A0ABZ0I0Z8_9GAMM|nr:aminotransferase class V-fold PLP-dependent enzyme [Congregibacter sp. IMCC43200]